MRRTRSFSFAALLLAALAPGPGVLAADDWIKLYRDATEIDLKAAAGARDPAARRRHYESATARLEQALKAKPRSDRGVREYGTVLFDYLPQYQLARAYAGLGRRSDAIAALRNEERQAVITRTPEYEAFRTLLARMESEQNQEELRRLRASFERAIADAEGGVSPATALDKAQEARSIAGLLDAAAQARADQLIERLRAREIQRQREADQKRLRDAIDSTLAEARRLMDDNRPGEALTRFNEVLKTDQFNATALEGRSAAQARVLASTTRATRELDLAEGRRLLEAGSVEAALPLLTEAAADTTLPAARDLLRRAQSILETRRQDAARQSRAASLRTEAEGLAAAGKLDQAAARLDLALGLAPNDGAIQTLLESVRTRASEAIIDRLLSDREAPLVTIVEPRESETQTFDDVVNLAGVATDDRGLAQIFVGTEGGALESQPLPETGGTKTARFEKAVPVSRGTNRLIVRVKDRQGRESEQVFVVERMLRFHEKPEFYPLVALGSTALLGAMGVVQLVRRRRALRSRFNPYIAGAPVLSDEMFFGRKKLMSRVMNMIHANSLMITGDRRIGKTSFMHHLKKALVEDEGTEFKFFPVSVDLQGVPEGAFFHTLMSEIVETLNPESAAELRWRPRHESEGEYDDRDFTRDLQRVIAELKTRTEKKVKLALLLDEVDELNEYSERVNQRLRSVFMKTFSESIVAVMSGVGIRRSWKSEGSPWYNFFDEFELSGLSRDEAEALIRTPVKSVFRFDDDAVDAILEATDLKPYLIQKYCIHTLNRIIEAGRVTVTREDVEAVGPLVASDEAADVPLHRRSGDRAAAPQRPVA